MDLPSYTKLRKTLISTGINVLNGFWKQTNLVRMRPINLFLVASWLWQVSVTTELLHWKFRTSYNNLICNTATHLWKLDSVLRSDSSDNRACAALHFVDLYQTITLCTLLKIFYTLFNEQFKLLLLSHYHFSCHHVNLASNGY